MNYYLRHWDETVLLLWDEGPKGFRRLPGADLLEWLALAQHDYDEVDRMLLDHETIGA